MQLTKLEIKGFKSFGDKITINFNEGVTAIVGPNGCGKSNVVDAIRWVLGEQSTKMLRSEKMENIIFNGTKNRKASNLAEVSLTFDNTRNILPTEFSQVTITRKLYRNGESEYRLNDVKCRLKDITDLFLDTGIGADSYSIIELRMIDEIINNKEHSRRTLFEEASGISKYKIRKKQTLTKLKDTQTDLDRVDDLLFEVEKNLKSLENQAKKTERYYKLKGEYKQASVALAKWRITEFKVSFEEIERLKASLESRLLESMNSIHQGESLLQNLKQQVLTKEKNLALQQKVTNEQLHKIRAYESEKKVKNEQLRNLQDREQRLAQDLAQDKQQVNHTLYNLKRLNEEWLIEQEKLEGLQKKVESKKLETDALRGQQLSKKAKLDLQVKENQKIQQIIYDGEKEIAVLHIQKDALDQESLRNRADTESKEVELHQFNIKVAELGEKTESLQSQYDFTLEEERKLQEQLTEAEQRIIDLKDELNRENRLIDAKQNEYNLTKSLVDNLEGFPESIRFLRKNAQWKQAYPLFSDILFCREEYRIAIENFLDPLMNHYVVSTTEEAIYAIRLLSDSARGRANFFILEALEQLEKSKTNADDLLENQDGIKLISALAVISVDEKYKQLCQILLKDVYLIQDPQQDENILAPYPDAIVLHPMGKFSKQKLGLSGGSIGLFEGKRIGRAKNLENLAKEIKKAQELTKHLDRELQEKSSQIVAWKASSQKSVLAELTQTLNRFQHELISVKTKQEQYESFILNSKNRKKDIAEKLAQIQLTLNQAEPHLEQLRRDKTEDDRLLAELQESYRELSDELTELSTAFNQENLKYHQQQNKTQSVLKDIEYRESQRDSFETRLEKNQIDFDATKKAIQDVLQHVDHSDEDLLAMYEQKDQMEAGLLAMEQEFQEERQTIQDREDKLAVERKQKESTDQEYQILKDRETQIRLDLNSLKERLSVEFNLDIRDFLDESPVEADENIDLGIYADADQDFLQEKTQKLKKQLEDFGTINPMAMEAYQEMDERYQFITKEKTDLLESKNSLLQTISEIDQVAREKFMEAFETVRQHFITVFRSLFNSEDNCDLILTDPNDPLGSDIDIIARPKGKRPLSINQLSGGEKTLTSTALLFSLYLLKPAPFCIFDEVDAPLDDTNIDKFNNIIREFSNQSQFIIVSHNKRTIASTDVIYGVTMIEQGVSRVVAVDMRDVA